MDDSAEGPPSKNVPRLSCFVLALKDLRYVWLIVSRAFLSTPICAGSSVLTIPRPSQSLSSGGPPSAFAFHMRQMRRALLKRNTGAGMSRILPGTACTALGDASTMLLITAAIPISVTKSFTFFTLVWMKVHVLVVSAEALCVHVVMIGSM